MILLLGERLSVLALPLLPSVADGPILNTTSQRYGGAGVETLDMPGHIDGVLLRLLDPQPICLYGGERVLAHWLN